MRLVAEVPPVLNGRFMPTLRARFRILSAVFPALALLCASCSATQFHQRERLNDRSMQLDHDQGLAYVRLKIEAAREGALGGYGSAQAGGCGCQ